MVGRRPCRRPLAPPFQLQRPHHHGRDTAALVVPRPLRGLRRVRGTGAFTHPRILAPRTNHQVGKKTPLLPPAPCFCPLPARTHAHTQHALTHHLTPAPPVLLDNVSHLRARTRTHGARHSAHRAFRRPVPCPALLHCPLASLARCMAASVHTLACARVCPSTEGRLSGCLRPCRRESWWGHSHTSAQLLLFVLHSAQGDVIGNPPGKTAKLYNSQARDYLCA